MNDHSLVLHMITRMEEMLSSRPSLEELARQSGYSPNRFRQKFYAVTGETPSEYMRKRRLTEAAKKLMGGAKCIDVALECGYSSQENFITAFRSFFGTTPAELFDIDHGTRDLYANFREVLNMLILDDLVQPAFMSTEMSCLAGMAGYFQLDLNPAMLYGLSGYGYMLNICSDVDASGPYAWNRKGYYTLLESLGICLKHEYEVTVDTPEADRLDIESTLRDELNNGNICVLGYLESQLFRGYDEKGFLFHKPWNEAPTELDRLSFNTWDECLNDKGWVNFAVFSRAQAKTDIKSRIIASLNHAMNLYKNPQAYALPGYSLQGDALETWARAAGTQKADEHGHWWCASVFAESRSMMSDFFSQIQGLFDNSQVDAQCADLCALFKKSAAQLHEAALCKPGQAVDHLKQCLDTEGHIESALASLYQSITL